MCCRAHGVHLITPSTSSPTLASLGTLPLLGRDSGVSASFTLPPEIPSESCRFMYKASHATAVSSSSVHPFLALPFSIVSSTGPRSYSQRAFWPLSLCTLRSEAHVLTRCATGGFCRIHTHGAGPDIRKWIVQELGSMLIPSEDPCVRTI